MHLFGAPPDVLFINLRLRYKNANVTRLILGREQIQTVAIMVKTYRLPLHFVSILEANDKGLTVYANRLAFLVAGVRSLHQLPPDWQVHDFNVAKMNLEQILFGLEPHQPLFRVKIDQSAIDLTAVRALNDHLITAMDCLIGISSG
nr:hypothetical protein [Thiorhodovibrio frisius]